MSSTGFDFDFVRVEKLAAMRRYTQQKKLKSFVFFVEIFVALAFLLFWYSNYYVPVLSDVAFDFLRRSVVVFGRSIYMFLLINVLVGVILFMSFQKQTKSDLYDDYISISAAASAVSHSDAETSTVTDRQLVCVENAEKNETSTTTKATKTAVTAAEVAEKEAAGDSPPAESVETQTVIPESIKYSRTRSEKYVKENRPELRRSGTVVRREKKPLEQPRRASSAMDDLSNEEFRSTIEKFIALKKKSLIRENTLDFIKLDRSRAVLSR